MKKLNEFIWETHGIHAGTENDHVKHGIDKLEDIVDKAIEHNHSVSSRFSCLHNCSEYANALQPKP